MGRTANNRCICSGRRRLWKHLLSDGKAPRGPKVVSGLHARKPCGSDQIRSRTRPALLVWPSSVYDEPERLVLLADTEGRFELDWTVTRPKRRIHLRYLFWFFDNFTSPFGTMPWLHRISSCSKAGRRMCSCQTSRTKRPINSAAGLLSERSGRRDSKGTTAEQGLSVTRGTTGRRKTRLFLTWRRRGPCRTGARELATASS